VRGIQSAKDSAPVTLTGAELILLNNSLNEVLPESTSQNLKPV
jgi:hypothetical protein